MIGGDWKDEAWKDSVVKVVMVVVVAMPVLVTSDGGGNQSKVEGNTALKTSITGHGNCMYLPRHFVPACSAQCICLSVCLYISFLNVSFGMCDWLALGRSCCFREGNSDIPKNVA